MFGASSELASVMEFGFNRQQNYTIDNTISTTAWRPRCRNCTETIRQSPTSVGSVSGEVRCDGVSQTESSRLAGAHRSKLNRRRRQKEAAAALSVSACACTMAAWSRGKDRTVRVALTFTPRADVVSVVPRRDETPAAAATSPPAVPAPPSRRRSPAVIRTDGFAVDSN